MELLIRRQSSMRRAVIAALSTLAMAVMACSAAGAADAQSAQPAQWVQKKINFVYMGFTSHYSCDGLRDDVRTILLELGARKEGLDVHEIGCTQFEGVPEPNPGVAGTFYVLEPVSQDQAASSPSTIVPAHWETVDVRLSRSVRVQAGHCELIEQVKQRILPLFNTRNVQYQSNCIPHEFTIPGAVLKAEVLRPDAAGAKHVAEAN